MWSDGLINCTLLQGSNLAPTWETFLTLRNQNARTCFIFGRRELLDRRKHLSEGTSLAQADLQESCKCQNDRKRYSWQHFERLISSAKYVLLTTLLSFSTCHVNSNKGTKRDFCNWDGLFKKGHPVGGSQGPVVKGGDSCSRGHEFESQRQILGGHFSHLL